MKVYELTKHQDYIYSLFENTFVGATQLIGWQTIGGESISRIVFQLKVNDISNNEINLSSYKNNEIEYKPGFIYIYSPNPFYICRAKILKQDLGIVTIELPDFLKTEKNILNRIKMINEKISKLKDSKVKKGPKSLDGKAYVKKVNEDEEFAAMRAAPRLKTQGDKKCKVEFLSRNKESKVYGLADLSRGGAGILVNNAEAFKKGDLIAIVEIDDKPIDPRLEGEIMSVRSHDVEKKLFKAGVKFTVKDDE